MLFSIVDRPVIEAPIVHECPALESGQARADFEDAPIVFRGETINVQDTRLDYGESRFQTVGYLAGRMVMVVWTPRDDARHVISMRKCNNREKKIYQKRFDQG